MIRINLAPKPCPSCQDEEKMWLAHMTYYTGLYGDETIVPKWLKCGWCRRLVSYQEKWEAHHVQL